MPNKYKGNACKRYLTSVETDLKIAHGVHDKNPFEELPQYPVAHPGLPKRYNKESPYSSDSATTGSHSTNIGNETNIVVENTKYNHILQKIYNVDENAAKDLLDILSQIEGMCGTIYKIPQALPLYQELVSAVKSTIPEFLEVASEARRETSIYVNAITSLDG